MSAMNIRNGFGIVLAMAVMLMLSAPALAMDDKSGMMKDKDHKSMMHGDDMMTPDEMIRKGEKMIMEGKAMKEKGMKMKKEAGMKKDGM